MKEDKKESLLNPDFMIKIVNKAKKAQEMISPKKNSKVKVKEKENFEKEIESTRNDIIYKTYGEKKPIVISVIGGRNNGKSQFLNQLILSSFIKKYNDNEEFFSILKDKPEWIKDEIWKQNKRYWLYPLPSSPGSESITKIMIEIEYSESFEIQLVLFEDKTEIETDTDTDTEDKIINKRYNFLNMIQRINGI